MRPFSFSSLPILLLFTRCGSSIRYRHTATRPLPLIEVPSEDTDIASISLVESQETITAAGVWDGSHTEMSARKAFGIRRIDGEGISVR